MFGLVAASRPPQEFVQVGEAEFLTEIGEVANINHVVIFMTGAAPFNDGIGGAVYIRWPTEQGIANWHYLGFVCNGKPSAIFKISQLQQSEAKHENVFGVSSVGTGNLGTAQVGIMVESLNIIEERVANMDTVASQKSTLAEFADKMTKNLVNHAESYAVRLPKPDGTGSADFIPISALQEWFTSFSRRFQQNPYFWKSLHND